MAKTRGDEGEMARLLAEENARRIGQGGLINGIPLYMESSIFYNYDDSKGLLNFRLYYQKETLDGKGNYHYRSHRLYYNNGEIICDGLPHITSSFYYLLKELPIAVRIPNYHDILHVDKAEIFRGSDILKHMLEKNVYLFKNIDKINAIFETYITAASLNLFIKYEVPFDFSLGYKVFNKRVRYLATKHFNKVLNNVLINNRTLILFEQYGWTMIGLDELDELINLYLITGAVGDMIFFRHGKECFCIINEYYSKHIITTGNYGVKSDQIITIKLAIESDNILALMKHEKLHTK